MKRSPLTLVLALAGGVALAADVPVRNPFQVPVGLDEPAVNQTAARPAEAPVELRLRATLLAGERSSVILDGAILMIGEEYSGYRLVSVREGEAVLWKNGESIRLHVDEDDG